MGGGGGGATFLKPFFKSSPNPCLFFSSPMTLIEGLEGLNGGMTSISLPIVLERGIGVGNVAMLIGRRLLRGGVAGVWVKVRQHSQALKYQGVTDTVRPIRTFSDKVAEVFICPSYVYW